MASRRPILSIDYAGGAPRIASGSGRVKEWSSSKGLEGLNTLRIPSLFIAVMTCSGVFGAGCTHGVNLVTGRIKPAHFKFTTVVKPKKLDPYGWRAVCIHARITHGNSEATDVCKFEVGLPIYNESQGEIPLEVAQQTAAELANRASYTVLSQSHPGEMLAVLCNDFKKVYEDMLREWFHGARVGQCLTPDIETVHFGIPDGCSP
jgi:hypothetical protein